MHQRLVSVSGRGVVKLQAAVLARVQDGVPAALRIGTGSLRVIFVTGQRSRSRMRDDWWVSTAGRAHPGWRDPGTAR